VGTQSTYKTEWSDRLEGHEGRNRQDYAQKEGKRVRTQVVRGNGGHGRVKCDSLTNTGKKEVFGVRGGRG